jgi:putative ABC transport system ATP-binding protein
MKQKPNQLSAGEQQRVAIARAFANKPAIILADEPTGNLDKKSGSLIMKLLTKLNQNIMTTIIVVTHDEKMALYATKKMIIEDGKITNMFVKQAK